MSAHLSIKDMLVDPSSHWPKPRDILKDKRLSDRQRLDLLTAWERDARALSVAADENMQGGEEARLGPVVKARIAAEEMLGIKPDANKGTHDKYGGR